LLTTIALEIVTVSNKHNSATAYVKRLDIWLMSPRFTRLSFPIVQSTFGNG
jgi:hypothetical protein